ncbi:ParB/RepB/Spo0J family partition protein [Desulfallas sp. Bu1-1]|uniref:ParB/RepB/Spo0J family partition protein n=1 Tax=Desulfallas sp. Bu1-1 TaxID=2787620 RepID=UPI00189F15FF|nr:ParB/RepB/Spo0J family partition protein [Desulfallas sp. Bu1-1]MBF7081382.1 ParB/RepB/Spo0J family partition protein [Desulfallas sp. Bu1-1]
MTKRRGLGRGLSALIPVQENVENGNMENELQHISLDQIKPNPNQPRQKIDEKGLEELMESIKTHGLIQPIIVRPKNDKSYEIIAGERRWQACKKLNMDRVPVIIRKYNDLEASAAALIENIQREDLNAVEEANAYKQLMDSYGLTQEELSNRVGKSRSFIANMIRLLTLPPEIREMLAEGVISAGHARALVALEDSETQIKFTLKIIKQQLSVRKTEEMVRKYIEGKGKERQKKQTDQECLIWERELAERLGKTVKIKNNSKGSGKLIIEYNNRTELIRLINKLKIS